MTSLPGASSLRALPPSDGEESESSIDSSGNSRRLLAHSLSGGGRGKYGSTARGHHDERENSGSTLVSPIIDDCEVVGERRGYLGSSGSVESSFNRRRTAADALQGGKRESDPSAGEDWYIIANPERRRDHLTRSEHPPTPNRHTPVAPDTISTPSIVTSRPSFIY